MSVFIFSVQTFLLWLLQSNNNVIEVGSWVHPNVQPELKNEQFLMIDFWATWCGPCIKAMDHMAELQKVTEEKVAFISVTREHQEIVENFFSNRTPKTLIAIDFEGRTFDKFNVSTLPYSILIAPTGEPIWQGLPNEMNFEKIKILTSVSYGKPTELNKKLITHREVVRKLDRKGKPITIGGINAYTLSVDEYLTFNRMDESCDRVDISGNIEEVLSSILSVPRCNVSTQGKKSIHGYFTIDTCITESNKNTVVDLLMQGFEAKYESIEQESEAYFMYLEDATMLWSKDVYQWDEDGKSNFLHSDFDLQGDNLTPTELASVLSRILNIDIRFVGPYNEIHDWSFAMGDMDFMIGNLRSEVGLKLVKKSVMSSKIILTYTGK